MQRLEKTRGASNALEWTVPPQLRLHFIRIAGVLEGQPVALRAPRPLSSDDISHSFVLEAPETTRMRASNKAFISACRMSTYVRLLVL